MKNLLVTFGQRFARYALAGLLAVLPLVLTVAIVIWVARFIEGFIGPNTALGRGLQSVGLRFSDNTALAYAIGWVAVLAVVVTVGIAVEMGAKRLVQRMIDGAFQRIPLINNVYSTSKQLVDLFDKRPDADMKAMSVVFCYFAEQGGPSVLALMPSADQFLIDGRPHHIVIIPTAPVPFGGALLFVPAELVKPADMSVDGLMSIYVSMGVTTPQYMAKGTRDAGVGPEGA